MDGDFLEKVKTLLSDPESLQRITGIAKGLSGGGEGGESIPTVSDTSSSEAAERRESGEEAAKQALAGLSAPAGGAKDSRLALLRSLKPLLREEKRKKVDSLLRAMSIASLMKSIK